MGESGDEMSQCGGREERWREGGRERWREGSVHLFGSDLVREVPHKEDPVHFRGQSDVLVSCRCRGMIDRGHDASALRHHSMWLERV